MACLAELQDGDRVAIRVSHRNATGPELVGTIRASNSGLRFDVENGSGPASYSLGPALKPLSPPRSGPPLTIDGIDLLETARQRRERKRIALRGALAYDARLTAGAEVAKTLETLAVEIAMQLSGPRLGRRAKELIRQFHDVANLVDLPRSKRNHLLFAAAQPRGVAKALGLSEWGCVAPSAEDFGIGSFRTPRGGTPSLFPARRPAVTLDPELEIRRVRRARCAAFREAEDDVADTLHARQ